jgi:multiple sugar transport system substrate-binding protein
MENIMFMIKIKSIILILLSFLFISNVYGLTLKISSVADPYASVFRLHEEAISKLGIDMVFDNNPPQDTYSKNMLDFAAGTSTYDIVLFMPAWLADYSRHLEPIGNLSSKYGLDFKLDDIVRTYRDVYIRWNGVDYAVPFDGDQHILFYNKKAFSSQINKNAFKKEYGYELAPPDTWDEYRAMAKFFNGRDWDGDGKTEYGVGEAWQRGGYAFWWWATKFLGNGGVWFDEDMNPLINGPSGIKALENTLAIKPYTPPGTANFGYPELEAAFLNGEVPMVIQWASTGKSAKDPNVSNIVNDVGATLVPGSRDKYGSIYRRPGLPTGWIAGIPKYSKNKEAAARVLDIISTPEASLQAAMLSTTYVDPWRKSSYYSDEWSNLWPNDPVYSKDYAAALRTTAETGFPDLQVPGTYEYWNSLDREISEAIAGNKTAEEALDEAAKEWNKITKRLGFAKQKKAWNLQYNALKSLGIKYRPELAR